MRLVDFLRQVPEEKLRNDSELKEAYEFLRKVFEEKQLVLEKEIFA
jgi:hypothetical protein